MNLAAVRGHTSTVVLLLMNGARVDTENKNGFTPLLAAAQNGHTEVCELLLKTGKASLRKTTPDGGNPLMVAAHRGHTEVCKLLLKTQISNGLTIYNLEETDSHGMTALNVAATHGHSNTVALLLSKGAKLETRNTKGFTPVMAAVQYGHTEVCKLLLETGKANVTERNPDGLTPLLAAAWKGHTEVCELLLDKSRVNIEDTMEDESTALKLAAQKGHASTVALLLSRGARTGARSKRGFTPLMAAVENGCTEVCQLLLTAHSEVEDKDPKMQFTALHLAAIYNYEKVILLLLLHKADVNSRARKGTTPLVLASQEGHVASVVTLLNSGADPLLAEDDGCFPIHAAADSNHWEVVRILIEQGRCSPDQVKHVQIGP